jgi:hypothetical protein
MQPDGQPADYALGHEVIVITQHQILGLAPVGKRSRFGRRQQLRSEPALRLAVRQRVTKFEALHQRQQLGVHVSVHGISPEALAIDTVEIAELRLYGFVVQDSKHGLGGPGVLQDHSAG